MKTVISTREQWHMLFAILAIPIPAAMFIKTMASAVQRPIIKGPTISANESCMIIFGSLIPSMTRVITPRMPQEKRKPNAILKESLVNLYTCLKTSIYDPKLTEAISPPAII